MYFYFGNKMFMRVLLSILFLLAVVGQSKAERNFHISKRITKSWISVASIQNPISFESGINDFQDFNDFNGPDLFIKIAQPEIQPLKYTASLVSIILPGTFTISFQYSLIDLPPPLFS